jgi:Ca2+/Na+ antiporter
VVHVVLLVGCALVIYLACEGFINAVEWLGVQLNVGPIAVGTILAAVGTALPESVMTLVAVTFSGGPHDADIGVGAAMGGPLVVGTIAHRAHLYLTSTTLGQHEMRARIRTGKRRPAWRSTPRPPPSC